MSWESAKRELKKLYKNPEKELLNINDDSNSYILDYSCKYMSKQQTTKQIGYCVAVSANTIKPTVENTTYT